MKCSNCGFISNKDFYRCPYCGKIHSDEDNVFKRTISIGSVFSVRLRTILEIIVFNLFGASVLVDWYLNFNYGITFWAFIVLFGFVLVVSILSRKGSLITAVEKTDIFILAALILGCGLCHIKGLFDIRAYFPSIIIPSFLVLMTLFSLSLVFRRTESKIRPLWTEVVIILHVMVISLIFTFFLINKYTMEAGVANPPFHYLALGSTKGNLTIMYHVETVLIYLAFGLTIMYLVNYNLILIGHIFRQVKGFYGKSRD